MIKVKQVLIALLFATAIVNNANAGRSEIDPTRNIIKLTLNEAIQSPGLVTAMFQQLNGGFLGGPGNNNLTLRVYYQNRIYMITGTVNQWNQFFRSRGITHHEFIMDN